MRQVGKAAVEKAKRILSVGHYTKSNAFMSSIHTGLTQDEIEAVRQETGFEIPDGYRLRDNGAGCYNIVPED